MVVRLILDLGFRFRVGLGLGMGGLAGMVRVRTSLRKVILGGINLILNKYTI